MNIPEFRKYLLTVMPEGFKIRGSMLLKDLKSFAIGIQVLQGDKRSVYNCALYVYCGNDFALPPMIFRGDAQKVEATIVNLKDVFQAVNAGVAETKLNEYGKSSNALTAIRFCKKQL